MLTIRHDLPDGFLHCQAVDLHQLFDGPTLIHLPGERPEPLFVSILLHGNEVSGLLVMQEVLRQYRGRSLPRACSLMVGNIAAAKMGVRYLPGEHDYNRIWYAGRDDEHHMTQQVLAEMRQRNVFAAIDLHNNTSLNPIYSIVAHREPRHLQLARSFSKIVVYSSYPTTTSTVAFSSLCPAITIEAGLPGESEGVLQTVEFMHRCLQTNTIANTTPDDIDLFHTIAVVKVARSCSCGLVGEDVDVQLFPGIDRYNFTELEPGTVLARLEGSESDCLDIKPTNGNEAKIDCIAIKNNHLTIIKPVMPAMLTTNQNMIRLDCFCYLMERLT